MKLHQLLLVSTLVACSATGWRAQESAPCLSGDSFVYCPSEKALYTASDAGKILKLDASGAVVWTLSVAGTRSELAISEKTLVVGTGGGELVGFSRLTGKVEWRSKARTARLLSAGGTVVAQSGKVGGLVGVDPLDGRTKWEIRQRGTIPKYPRLLAARGSEVLTDTSVLDGSSGVVLRAWPEPAYDITAGTFLGDLVVLASHTRVTAFRSDGAPGWDIELPDRTDEVRISALGSTSSGLLVLQSDSSRGRATLSSISPSGSTRWTVGGSTELGTPAGPLAIIRDLAVAFGLTVDKTKDNVLRLGLEDGAVIWRKNIAALPTPAHGLLPCDASTCVFRAVAGTEDAFFQLDPRTGIVKRLF